MLESLALCSIIAIGVSFIFDLIKNICHSYSSYIAKKKFLNAVRQMILTEVKVKETENGTKKNTRKSKKS